MRTGRCPDCGYKSVAYNKKRKRAECRRSVCDFEEDMDHIAEYKQKYGVMPK